MQMEAGRQCQCTWRAQAHGQMRDASASKVFQRNVLQGVSAEVVGIGQSGGAESLLTLSGTMQHAFTPRNIAILACMPTLLPTLVG